MLDSWTPPQLPAEGRRISLIGKGGAIKTTVAAHCLHYWHQHGVPCEAIDADEPGEGEDGSLYTWDLAASLGPRVRPQYSPTALPREMRANTPAHGVHLTDTGAWSNRPSGVHHSVLVKSHLVVFCIQPTEMEMERGASLASALDYIAETGAHVPEVVFLLTRTNSSAAATQEARDEITASGFEALRYGVPNRQGRDGYGRSFRKTPAITPGDAMEFVAREILDRAARVKETV